VTVIDHEPSGWFLVRDGVRLLFDVNCSHGAVSYPFLMELNDAEKQVHAARGHAFLSELAEKIQHSAPGVIGNVSPFRGRNLQGPDRSGVDELTTAWVKGRSGAL
jgi:hypothetical protein